ncbi:MAG: amino acid adenylation domain-containing protein, partial [Acidobacteriia bacterium]|nr:amino acid adenylation domain-containing protein [Terriglobia bacterium]
KKLREKDIEISVDGGNLRVRGGRLALSDSGLLELIRQNKEELIEAIASGEYLELPNGQITVPPVRIPADCTAITPEMLPLADLSQEQIEEVVGAVPGGVGNVQDIYALAPLQKGILFHHMLGGEGDPYLLSLLLGFVSRARLEDYLAALQAVIDRHDILRTAVMWEGMAEPVQMVWRKAVLPVEEVVLEGSKGDVGEQLYARFDPRSYRMDLRQAPLMRAYIAEDKDKERWLMLLLLHHLAGDHVTMETAQREIELQLLGKADQLPAPQPYRNLVAQARLGKKEEEHEAFFRAMLGDVEEPTAPFGLLDAQGDGRGIEQASVMVDEELERRLRERGRKLGVSAASLCHLAWAQVLARVSGREDVVFGTVLFGRMQAGTGGEQGIGLFINTLPVRMRVGEEGAEASVREMHRRLAELMGHEHASLALAQRCSGVPAPTPLFSALLNYRHSRRAEQNRAEEELRAWAGMERLRGEERTSYPFVLSVDDLGEGFRLTAQVPGWIGAKRVCEYVSTAVGTLIQALETAPGTAVRTLGVMPEWERQQVLSEWNRTATEYRRSCVHELFEEQVNRTPEAVAVEYEGRQLSYAELNRRANQLGHYLRKLGVGPEVLVGICMERSLEMVVGLLGILKAGGAYLPLDPDFPEERLAWMLEDSRVAVLLTQERLQERLPQYEGKRVALDRPGQEVAEESDGNLGRGSGLGNAVYVIYTSGSTGRPKGVLNLHGGLSNRLQWMQEAYRLDERDRVLQKTPFTFDVSVWEFFWPLMVGARLVMARPGGQQDPDYLMETIRNCGITTLHFVPPMLSAWLDYEGAAGCSSLKRVICSGEALNLEVQRKFQRTLKAELHNLYGPTEASIDVTCWHCREEDAAECVPIGRPIGNTQVYVLDENLEPAPVGMHGELYLGGAGLARGYQNRPEQTAEKFLSNPFSRTGGERLYRTGDRVRWRADGQLEFLGRLDHQVKLRGYRIELGEIELALREQAGVRQAMVVLREDHAGDKRLVAYVIEETGTKAGELRDALHGRLPEYMVPSAIVTMEEFPLTSNGKVDRKALPEPEGDAYAKREYEAPQGEVERAIAAIWADELKVDRVGRHDNFFRLGGHSLLAARVVERMRRSGLKVDVRVLFVTASLADLANSTEELTEIIL